MATTRLATPAFYDTAHTRYQASRVVRAQPDEVFAALADTPAWPTWFPGITGARWTSEAPHGIGSTRSVSLGPITIDEEFIVWEPGQRWGFTFVSTTIPLMKAGAELVELAAEAGGTRVTYNMFVDPFGPMKATTNLMRGGVEAGLKRGLKGLDIHLSGPIT